MADNAPQENPIETILRIGAGLWQSRALWAAARLRIADAIADAPATVEEIAAQTGTKPDMLRRLLNALAAIGFFACDADGRFGHSDLSRLLRADHPLSQRSFVESVFGHEHYAAWGDIEESLRSGVTAFDHQFAHELAAEKCSFCLDIQNVVPIFFRRVECGLRKSKARAIDQNEGEVPALYEPGYFLFH